MFSTGRRYAIKQDTTLATTEGNGEEWAGFCPVKNPVVGNFFDAASPNG
jgi:hypothetical protein